MLIWIIVALLACAAAIGGVLLLVGWTTYLIVGICSTYVGTLVLAFKAHPVIITSILGGALIGLFWPAAAVLGVAWLIVRRRLNDVLTAVAAYDVSDRPSQSPEHRKSSV